MNEEKIFYILSKIVLFTLQVTCVGVGIACLIKMFI
jgi:hypothetical protein